MTDKSMMPFGKHKGKPLIAVPPGYLIYIYENMELRDPLKTYIKDNLEALRIEKKREELRNRKDARR